MAECDKHEVFDDSCPDCISALLDKSGSEELFKRWKDLTDDERINIHHLLFREHCLACGKYDGDTLRGCQCWNDE